MEFITALLSPLISFFDYIYSFFTVTLVQYILMFTDWLIVKLTVFYIEIQIRAISSAWALASQVLASISITPLVSTYINRLPANLGYTASMIGLVDGLNIVLQASVTSWILKFTRIL